MIPIPLRDNNPTYRFPYVTVAIIVINAAAWIFELTYTGGVQNATLDYGAIPKWILHGTREGHLPSLPPNTVLYQEVPPLVTVLTSMFLHGGWWHLISNMWFLWIFGDNLEDAMGHVRYIVFYLLCGVAAASAQIFATPNSTAAMVGASGAIAGVLGGYALLYPRARVRCLWILIIFITTIELPAWLLLGIWFAQQFLVPSGSGIAWMAHVGGFLAGLALVRLFVKSRPVKPERVVWYERPE